MARCIDYPCCGHTPADPCDEQWYDKPGAFDTSRPGNEHALCDHASGDCAVDLDDDDDASDAEGDCRICYPFPCDDPDRHLGIPAKYRTPGCHCGADIDGRDCMCFET
jgi:hypothetical protein